MVSYVIINSIKPTRYVPGRRQYLKRVILVKVCYKNYMKETRI